MNGQLTKLDKMTSMQIAEVTGKEHKNILRDIKDEAEKLKNGGINGALKFELSSYTTGQNKEMPCYVLTKEGVLQLAARYDAVVRAKLIELAMKQEQKPTCLEDVLIQSLQEMKAIKCQLSEVSQQAQEVKQDLQNIRDTIVLDPNSWRQDTSRIINQIARNLGGNEHIKVIRTEAYQLLDTRFGVSLETRLTNKRRRMADEGVCKSKRDRLNQLDVIADDKKLIEGFVAIVKQMAVKYGIEKKGA